MSQLGIHTFGRTARTVDLLSRSPFDPALCSLIDTSCVPPAGLVDLGLELGPDWIHGTGQKRAACVPSRF